MCVHSEDCTWQNKFVQTHPHETSHRIWGWGWSYFFAKSRLLTKLVYTSADTTPLIKNSHILYITVLRLSRHKEVPTSMFPRSEHVGECGFHSRVALAFGELKSK